MKAPLDRTIGWNLPFGANVIPSGVFFRVWAPKATSVDVEVYQSPCDSRHQLAPEGDGAFSGAIAGVGAGARYRLRLDGAAYPDPWSRSQPEGVHGPSEVVDPSSFTWTDTAWGGLESERLIFYEMHVGTYTPKGTFDALVAELPELRRLGITAIELMPVAEFPGRHNWGYDGVGLFAPTRNYGGAAGLKRLIDAAHREGLAVFLDVVLNHLGPDGNYLRAFSDDYFTDRYQTPWGEALNVEGPAGARTREFLVRNICYWLGEYHLDGIRLDATHAIYDSSLRHILADIAALAHEAVGDDRRIQIIAEDSRNDVSMVRPATQGGLGLDAIWADDFHHAMHVLLTGEKEGYYIDYDGSVGSLGRTIECGLLYQGEPSRFRGSPRGAPVGDTPAKAFIFCLQNHDQVGNRARGERLNQLTDLANYAAATALFLLSPEIPLIFMGQEFAATSPFLYFTDHEPGLGKLVSAGRRAEFAHFTAFSDPGARNAIPDPQASETFEQSKLNLSERQRNRGIYRLHRDLLRLRRNDRVFSDLARERTEAHGIGNQCVAMRRWSADGAEQRLVIANFGDQVSLPVDSDTILSCLNRAGWRRRLWTNASPYRDGGIAPHRFGRDKRGWLDVPAHGAVVYSLHLA